MLCSSGHEGKWWWYWAWTMVHILFLGDNSADTALEDYHFLPLDQHEDTWIHIGSFTATIFIVQATLDLSCYLHKFFHKQDSKSVYLSMSLTQLLSSFTSYSLSQEMKSATARNTVFHSIILRLLNNFPREIRICTSTTEFWRNSKQAVNLFHLVSKR